MAPHLALIFHIFFTIPFPVIIPSTFIVALKVMESNKSRALSIVQNANLIHPDPSLIETFLNDAVDGDQAARYLLQTYVDKEGGINLTRFVHDWKDLVKLCKVYPRTTGTHY